MTDIAGLCERLRAALEGVTPGPWQSACFRTPQAKVYNVVGDKLLIARVHEGNPKRASANAAFIALSREAVPALLDTLERQAAEIERMREGLGDIVNIAGGDIISVRVKKRAKAALTGEDA